MDKPIKRIKKFSKAVLEGNVMFSFSKEAEEKIKELKEKKKQSDELDSK